MNTVTVLTRWKVFKCKFTLVPPFFLLYITLFFSISILFCPLDAAFVCMSVLFVACIICIHHLRGGHSMTADTGARSMTADAGVRSMSAEAGVRHRICRRFHSTPPRHYSS